ncbi:DUF4279 domain-containing protein [Sphingopyxis sp. R3-92]|uniref:DUF4279 domain-containing protein n=1 Tax=Sphingopyxis sp. R3-92 TaxID=3158553 RepID=UPI003EE7FAD8
MGKLRQSASSLCFYGDNLEPNEITALLGAPPTVGVLKGDRWLTSRGSEKIAGTGSWRIKTEYSEPEDLNRQIESLLSPLSNDLVVWRDLTSRFRGVIFCGLWLGSYNDGLELSAKTLGSMGDRGLLFDMDIYATDDPD